MSEIEQSTIKIVLRTRPTQYFASGNIKMDLNENVRINTNNQHRKLT